MKLKSLSLIILAFFAVFGVFAQENISISGTIEWDSFQMKSLVSLDLASAGLRMPSGRNQGEELVSEGYLTLVLSSIMNLQVDSSSTIGDLLNKRELSLREVEALALGANSVPPALSSDMRNMTASYTLNLSNISVSLLRHNHPSHAVRTLNPVSAANYTGIIIIADGKLPSHGTRSSFHPVPCLFPKIWDSEMNLIYERSMLEDRIPMVRYSSLQNIFQSNPSGLSPEIQQIAGERPLRIFARGVFGINPTDLIIDRNDALLIISSHENRRLLSQGKVVIILDDSVLKNDFNSLSNE